MNRVLLRSMNVSPIVRGTGGAPTTASVARGLLAVTLLAGGAFAVGAVVGNSFVTLPFIRHADARATTAFLGAVALLVGIPATLERSVQETDADEKARLTTHHVGGGL